MIKIIIRVLLLLACLSFITAVPLFSQITVNPNSVLIQSGTQLFCGARYLNTPVQASAPVQVYCFKTITTPWDRLGYNHIFYVDPHDAVIAEYNVNYDLPTNKNVFTFIMNRAGDNVLHWNLTLNGSPISSGIFQ